MTKQKQQAVGLFLTGLIFAAWLGLHIYAVFFHAARLDIVTVFLIAILTWLSVGLFITAHDAMHRSLAPLHPRLNNVIGAVAIFLYAGFLFRHLLPLHHAHHAAPGGPDDPDFHPDAPRHFLPWYWRFFKTYFGWRQIVHMNLRVVLYLLLGARLENILLFFALPGIASSLQLFLFGTWLPHRHDDRHFADHHNARTNDYPIWLSLLTCFHFGYHHEHHLKPGTPWWALPQARRDLNR